MKKKIKKILYFIGKNIYIKSLQPTVVDVEGTFKKIINDKVSVSRYGDGEIKTAIGMDMRYNYNQKRNKKMEKRLREILKSDLEGHIVCVENCFNNSMIERTDGYKKFWYEHMGLHRWAWNMLMKRGKIYYSTEISRCYLSYIDKNNSIRDFILWKQIWNNRNVIVVEGNKTGVGNGNDLLDNAKSIKRIIIPAENAYEKYDDILSSVVEKGCKDDLILIAAGPTATILAYDLANMGYQAIDIGHVDIEYEWFLQKVKVRSIVQGKYVNELVKRGGTNVEPISGVKYDSEVIARIE